MFMSKFSHNEHRCHHYHNLSRLILDRLKSIPPGCRCPRQCRFPSLRMSKISGNSHNRAEYDCQWVFCRYAWKKWYTRFKADKGVLIESVLFCHQLVSSLFVLFLLSSFSKGRLQSPRSSRRFRSTSSSREQRWRRSRRRCRRWRWRRTTPATGSTSARSSARLLGSVSLFSLFTCWLRQELFTLAPFYTMTLQLKYVW